MLYSKPRGLLKKAVYIAKNEGIKSLLIKALKFVMVKLSNINPIYAILAFIAGLRLAYISSKAKSVNDVVKIAFTFKFLNIDIKPAQIECELKNFLEIISDRKPRIIMEIGTARGGTLYAITRCAPSKSIIISIDLPRGPFGGGYPAWKIPLYILFALGKNSNSANKSKLT